MKKLSITNDKENSVSPSRNSIVKNISNQRESIGNANNRQSLNPKQIPNAKNLKNGKIQMVIEEEIILPSKEKTLERFIYITSYNDSELMKILKDLFESINKEAFELKSIKETYTKTLTPEERDDNNIDYISGFQLVDSKLRITILEGISSKAMQIVKQKLPKLQLNDHLKKIFSDNRILFNTRIYSNFNLCLKLIKIRDNLEDILLAFDIYQKANKHKEIYSAFMNLGFILQSKTFQEISQANLFPTGENMLLLERKYADIINDEDMTGIYVPPKIKKKRIKAESLEKSHFLGQNTSTTSLNNTTEFVSINQGSHLNTHSDSAKVTIITHNNLSKVNRDKSEPRSKSLNNLPSIHQNSPSRMKLKPKLDSHNYEYLKQKENKIINKVDYQKKNTGFVRALNLKANSNNFCKHKSSKSWSTLDEFNNSITNKETFKIPINQPTNENDNPEKNKQNSNGNFNNENVYLYSNQRKNYYADYFDNLRVKLEKDKNSFYTYSQDHLTLSYPMIKNSNAQYDEYIENRRKWFGKDRDFNRYQQPKREYVYFPKIQNEL